LPENGLYTQFNHRKADGVFITQRLFRNSTKKLTTLSFWRFVTICQPQLLSIF